MLKHVEIDAQVPGPKIDVGKLAMAVAPLAAHIDISCSCLSRIPIWSDMVDATPEMIDSMTGWQLQGGFRFI